MRLFRNITITIGLATIVLACLAACSFAPDYQPPPTPVPVLYNEKTGDGWIPAQPADTYPRGEWWHVFNDPILDALEGEVTDANQDLRAAVARYDQAQAAIDAANAALFPLINASASSERDRESKHRPLFSTATPSVYSDHVLNFSASYEVDVWGRIRNAIAAANETAQATQADLESANLSLHAQLASDYFQLRGQDLLQNLFDETITGYRKALELTEQRYQVGIAAQVDVAQAQSQLQLALAQADDVRRARAQLEHAIAVLVGEPSPAFNLSVVAFRIDPPGIPAGLPSQLLERRPDVAAAERRTAAANSQIGVAIAAFYPSFDLNAAGGLEGNSLSNWITAPSRFWSFGPSAALTLFDAGEREAITQEAQAAADENAADYRSTVLNAYREVEDALSAMRTLDDESQAEANAVIASQKALQFASDRYANGINTYLEVVTAQATALDAERSQANILVQRMNARVSLIQALGGVWGPLARPTLAQNFAAADPAQKTWWQFW